jgi:hypothetical protein
MQNPFRYGTVVTGKDFVDREEELGEVLKEIRGGKSVVVYSNRRMGKSSLLEELARRNKKEFVFVRVDLYGMTDKNALLNALVSETVRSAYGRMEKLASGIMELIKGTTLRFVISDTGRLGVEFASGQPRPAEILDALDLPEKVAVKKRKRIVVVFDEFQEVRIMDGVALLKAMRSRFQMHKHAVYIFSGSKRHLLHEIFEEPEGAFFKFARSMELGPLPREDLEKFLVSRFAAADGRLDPALAKEIVSITKGHPYYTQQIAHELFNIKRTPSSKDDVSEAIRVAVEHQSLAFSNLWDSVKSPSQRNLLIALAFEGKTTKGSEFVSRYGLKTRSHVQRAEGQLEARGIIDRGKIVDPLFAMWLRQIGAGWREQPF